jgi:ribosome-associated toxin RatA of RatAB toxin-antitoxin module
MQAVRFEHVIEGWERGSAFERLKDGDQYQLSAPEHVKSVVVEPTDDPHVSVSYWELFFRNGLLEWKERDFYDDENATLRFEQIEGDFDEFHGEWQILSLSDDPKELRLKVIFSATFDFGVPSFAEIVEPIAVQLLKNSIGEVLTDMFRNK